MRKLMSSPSIVFKGSGWAKKDAHDSRASARPKKAADGGQGSNPSDATESAKNDGSSTTSESKPGKAGADGPAGGGAARPTEMAEFRLGLPAHVPEPVRPTRPPRSGWQARVERIANQVTSTLVVSRALAVVNVSNGAGAPLFASALAFSTVFAIVPVVLLMSGVLGWFVDDPAQRSALLNQLVAYVPPLADLFRASLEGVVAARGALSIVGIVGLIWGASAFYGALDEVMRRLFQGDLHGTKYRAGYAAC